jgi:hypothetical protein
MEVGPKSGPAQWGGGTAERDSGELPHRRTRSRRRPRCLKQAVAFDGNRVRMRFEPRIAPASAVWVGEPEFRVADGSRRFRMRGECGGSSPPNGGMVPRNGARPALNRGRLPPSGARSPPIGARVAPNGGDVPRCWGRGAPNGGDVPPSWGRAARNRGEAAPIGAGLAPIGGDLAPFGGDLAPFGGDLAPAVFRAWAGSATSPARPCRPGNTSAVAPFSRSPAPRRAGSPDC